MLLFYKSPFTNSKFINHGKKVTFELKNLTNETLRHFIIFRRKYAES